MAEKWKCINSRREAAGLLNVRSQKDCVRPCVRPSARTSSPAFREFLVPFVALRMSKRQKIHKFCCHGTKFVDFSFATRTDMSGPPPPFPPPSPPLLLRLALLPRRLPLLLPLLHGRGRTDIHDGRRSHI